MTSANFLRFDPVPVRPQHNGWSPALQLRFVVALARGASVEEAARSLGKTRQSVYALRGREDAGSFAAAWDAALNFARTVRTAARSPAHLGNGIETLLVPRHYRGRFVGYVQREDLAGAMRLLGRLDRMADKLEADADYRAGQAATAPYDADGVSFDGIDAMRL